MTPGSGTPITRTLPYVVAFAARLALALLVVCPGVPGAPRPALAAQEPAAAARDGLAPEEEAIARWVREHAGEAIAFLESVVDINSGTMNHAGVRATADAFEPELRALGFETRWIDMSAVNRAGHLFAERRGDRGKKLLLIGHLDTVFEEDSPFQRFELLEDSIARGPGIEDMKGGDVVLLWALKALHAAGELEGADITVALIGDEEDPGQPVEVTRRPLVEAGERADVALGFEGASGDGNQAVVARRGSSGWTLRVTGTPGHSSQVFGERYGSGAIFEAARILWAFHEEVRGEEYLTFNPGIILGGTDVDYDGDEARGTAFGKTNVIAETAVVDGGLRFISEEQKERGREAMRAVVARHLPRTSAEISFRDSYPAMEPTDGNYALLALLDRVSRDLGHGAVGAVDPGARGAADISFVAADTDGLDGLGILGSAGHTVEETADLRSLAVQAARAAILIRRLLREEAASE